MTFSLTGARGDTPAELKTSFQAIWDGSPSVTTLAPAETAAMVAAAIDAYQQPAPDGCWFYVSAAGHVHDPSVLTSAPSYLAITVGVTAKPEQQP